MRLAILRSFVKNSSSQKSYFIRSEFTIRTVAKNIATVMSYLSFFKVGQSALNCVQCTNSPLCVHTHIMLFDRIGSKIQNGHHFDLFYKDCSKW